MDFTTFGMIAIFVIGYIVITIEHVVNINKATTALMMAILVWALYFAKDPNISLLNHHLANASQVVFFLLGALTIVELISSHKGFKTLAELLKIPSKRTMLWVVGIVTFFLSSVLDNLTTTIVMVTLLKKLIGNSREDRLLIGGAVVIAANAGGAWTPIGDVTTTMLWIGGQISSLGVIRGLFLPSVACLIGGLIPIHFMLKGHFRKEHFHPSEQHVEPFSKLVFILGIGFLIFVPIFKTMTGLPPFMGIFFGLSILWFVTDLVHLKEHDHLRVPYVMSKVDLSSPLFFLGILLSVNALESAGLLENLAHFLDSTIGNTTAIATAIGLASAVVDNIPLVAASMGTYELSRFSQDNPFWMLIAYAAGTGGSILLIGSAAGVAFMGMEKVDFFWYTKRISLAALIGYFSGIAVYLLL